MSSRWLTAFLEAGGDAHVVTIPARAENAKKAKNTRYEPVKPTFGNSGNFGTYPEKQNSVKEIPSFIAWDAADWKAFYDERAGIAEHDGRLSRPDAERMAYESCISHWMNKNPPAHSDPNTCPQCDKAIDVRGKDAIAVLTGNGSHLWLHDRCHTPWLAHRRQEAVKALGSLTQC